MFVLVRGAILVLMIFMIATFSGCGGGGSADSAIPGGTALPVKTLNWEAPRSYSNGTPMNPLTDLDRFEVYVNESGSFSDSETPQVILSAVDPATRQLTTSFNLGNIAVLTRGPRYWVSLRAVALTTGFKSDFSAPVSFSF